MTGCDHKWCKCGDLFDAAEQEPFVLRRRSPRGALEYLVGRGDDAVIARAMWLEDHGAEVLALIDADAVIERAIDKELGPESVGVVSAFFERRRLVAVLTTTPEADKPEATEDWKKPWTERHRGLPKDQR